MAEAIAASLAEARSPRESSYNRRMAEAIAASQTIGQDLTEDQLNTYQRLKDIVPEMGTDALVRAIIEAGKGETDANIILAATSPGISMVVPNRSSRADQQSFSFGHSPSRGQCLPGDGACLAGFKRWLGFSGGYKTKRKRRKIRKRNKSVTKRKGVKTVKRRRSNTRKKSKKKSTKKK